MRKFHENRPTKAKWERILAFALALSMLIIHIQFPGAAHAEGETGSNSQYYYTNNFDDPNASDDSYQWTTAQTESWDVKYSWTEELYNDKCSGQIVQDTDGSYYYRLNPVASDRTTDDKIPYSFSYVWLNAVATDPGDAANTADVTDTWTGLHR